MDIKINTVGKIKEMGNLTYKYLNPFTEQLDDFSSNIFIEQNTRPIKFNGDMLWAFEGQVYQVFNPHEVTDNEIIHRIMFDSKTKNSLY